MATLNAKPVRLLMHDMAAAFALQPGEAFSRDRAIQWFAEHYPNIKEGTVAAHLIRLSTNVRTRLHYSARDDGSDDLFFKIDASHFRQGRDPVPITSGTPVPDEAEASVLGPSLSEEFAFEHDLRDYLTRNLQALEPGLRPYQDEGITGVEFPVGGRFIDILAVARGGDYAVQGQGDQGLLPGRRLAKALRQLDSAAAVRACPEGARCDRRQEHQRRPEMGQQHAGLQRARARSSIGGPLGSPPQPRHDVFNS